MMYYAISYDPMAAFSSEKQLLAFLAESRNISSWSKPFSGLILVKSTLSTDQLAHVFRGFFPDNVQFIVCEATREHSFAFFSQPIWDWFNQDSFLQYLTQEPK